MSRTTATSAFLTSACAAILIAAGASPAHADWASVYAQAHGGAAGGRGMSGDLKADAFHKGTTGMAYGAIVGAEFFFVDAWIGHNQYVGSDGLLGTWTQFMLGLDVEMPMGDKKGVDYDAQGRPTGGYSSSYAELGLGVGFGVGTGQQVDPPLDNSEVTDKGFLFEGRVALGYRLTRMLSLALMVPIQAGYFTKSGDGVFANDVDNHYVEMNGAVLGAMRLKFEL